MKFIGDNFYKHEPYTSDLQILGIEVLYGPYYASNWKQWIKENGNALDYVILYRPHIAVKYIDHIRRYSDAHIAYSGVDLHYLREQRRSQYDNDPSLLEKSAEWKKIELELCSKADVSFYPTQVEIDVLEPQIENFTGIAIPVCFYPAGVPKRNSFKETSNLLFVGGFGHPPNLDGLLWFVDNIFPIVLETNREIKLHIVGSNMPQEVLEYGSNPNIILEGSVSDTVLGELYARTRMAIIPLRYGAGMKGKVVEALYHRLPLVTTSIGAEGYPEADEIMCIVDSSAGFAQKIIENYNSEGFAARYQEIASDYLKKYFSDDAVLKKLEHVYDFGKEK